MLAGCLIISSGTLGLLFGGMSIYKFDNYPPKKSRRIFFVALFSLFLLPCFIIGYKETKIYGINLNQKLFLIKI